MCYHVVQVSLFVWAVYRESDGDDLVLVSRHESESNARTLASLLNRRAAKLRRG